MFSFKAAGFIRTHLGRVLTVACTTQKRVQQAVKLNTFSGKCSMIQLHHGYEGPELLSGPTHFKNT